MFNAIQLHESNTETNYSIPLFSYWLFRYTSVRILITLLCSFSWC